MGNPPKIITVLVYNFWDFFSDFTYIVYLILSLVVLTLFGIILTFVYKKVRSKFPVEVNCWFCNNNTTVPYELYNCWDCPHCKQYNGFDKDGGYNRIIPEQYNLKLNEKTFTASKIYCRNSDINPQNNGFCKLCNINQQLKIQQLALFVPLDENNYYQEIEQYREKLEKAYKLCFKCEQTLQETLQKQEYNLLTNRLNFHKYMTSIQKAEVANKFFGKDTIVFFQKNVESGLKVLCIIIVILLFLALLNYFETENQFLKFALTDIIFIKPVLPTLKVLLNYIEKIYSFKKELSFAGLVLWFLADFHKNVKKSYMYLLIWGFFHISLWSPFTGLQILLSGIYLILSFQLANEKFIYLCKKSLPRKSGFQHVKVFPEVHNTLSENNLLSNTVFSSLGNHNFTSIKEDNLLENKIKKIKQKPVGVLNSQEKMKRTKKNENETELLPNEEKEKESKSLNSSFTAKSFLSYSDLDKNCGEANGPFSEVNSTLNSLHLSSGKQKKPNKPPNFLFSNHNFDVKSSSSIIKPARFIKNLNSTPWTESNECNSRSSTPSSGYSSQKPEKPEPNRYDFPKIMTPFSVNSFSRHSPSNCCEHYDGNHMFYNNMNCFSPSFLPFQQYPGSLGHTAIYTCTRPTNFPFPFPPYQGFSNPKFSPGSIGFPDTSNCTNLFQESTKTFERTKRWCKLKSFLYYFSIFLNITTIISLCFCISTGVVLIDWKLPNFNFFM